METPETTTVDIIVHQQARCEACFMMYPLAELVDNLCLNCEEWDAEAWEENP